MKAVISYEKSYQQVVKLSRNKEGDQVGVTKEFRVIEKTTFRIAKNECPLVR